MPGYHIVWVVGFAGLVIATGYVLGERRQSRLLRAVFIPGHLLLAGLQVFVCEVFRIHKEKAGVLRGKTTRQLRDLPPIKRWALNFGPFLFQFVALAVLLWLLGVEVKQSSVSPPSDYSAPAAAIWRFGHTVSDVVSSSFQRIWEGFEKLIEDGNPTTLLVVWVVLSLVVASVPPKGSGRHIIAGFVVVGLVVWLFSWLGLALRPNMVLPRRLDSFMATACGFAFWVFIASLLILKLPQLIRRRRPSVTAEVEEEE